LTLSKISIIFIIESRFDALLVEFFAMIKAGVPIFFLKLCFTIKEIINGINN